MSDIIHTSSSAEEAIILFEISSAASGARSHLAKPSANSMELATKSAQALGQAMGTIQSLANRTAETLHQLPQKPSEVELEFGIKIDGDAGAIVAKNSSEGNLRIKLVWRNGD
ncbi:MAG TPA: CU044_2847 family protein [Trichocoleus sp.]